MGNLIELTSEPLPTGTVTFLFTDIEGSTSLAKRYPEDLPALMAQHHAILRDSIQACRGQVFEIIGDAFCAAFYTAGDALNAAIEAQRRLQHAAWDPAPVKVRMGIHTGAAQAKGSEGEGRGYTGYLTLAHVQRVMSAAHGGQVLISEAASGMLVDLLPEGASLLDLGAHRLKGLEHPEHLFQLHHPDLEADFPPIESPDHRPNNLPAQPTALIGREAELAELLLRLSSPEVRLVTLTGPGGIGKTRLALQAAAELSEHIEYGVYFVDLAPSRDAESALAAIAKTLSIKEASDQPLLPELIRQLRTKSILLVLDNFEQVTEAAPEVAQLARECPKLKFLVTSREALRVRGEYIFPVPPLSLPGLDLKGLNFEQLAQFEAVQLFRERAQAVKPDFELTRDNAPAVAEICVRLDGLPLAIELATARIKLFSPQALLDRLGSRLKMLRGGARDLPVRQQTLRDTIDWSYALLDAEEQCLFELLSVFLGCTFGAVEAVAEWVTPRVELGDDILEGLASLVDKSLVRQTQQDSGEPRLLMLETIREYAGERLEEDPELSAAAMRAHASYYADFTQRQWERLTGDEREAAIAELEADIENVRTAWSYWAAEQDLKQLGKFIDSLWFLYDARGWYRALVELTTDLLNVLSAIPSTAELAREKVVIQTGLARALLALKGYTPEVEEAYSRALELTQTMGDDPSLFPVLRGLATFYIFKGEFEKAAHIGEQILSLAEHSNDTSMLVEAHLVLGSNLSFLDNLKMGLEHLEKGIALYDPDRHSSHRFRMGNNPGVVCRTTSAFILWMLGFPDRALKRMDDAIDLAKRLNHPYTTAYAMFHTGLLHFWRREAEQTLGLTEAVLEIAGEHEFGLWNAVGLCLHGAALAGLGRAEEGLAQIQQGMHIYQGLKTPPVFWPLLLSIQAGVCGQMGRPAEGLILIDEAIHIPSQGYGGAMSGEFYRLKGELLLAQSPGDPREAETWLLRALEVAQAEQATMLELHAAVSLSRIWRAQGKAEEIRQVLSEIYGRFNEGFSTADLIDARTLLEELSR